RRAIDSGGRTMKMTLKIALPFMAPLCPKNALELPGPVTMPFVQGIKTDTTHTIDSRRQIHRRTLRHTLLRNSTFFGRKSSGLRECRLEMVYSQHEKRHL